MTAKPYLVLACRSCEITFAAAHQPISVPEVVALLDRTTCPNCWSAQIDVDARPGEPHMLLPPLEHDNAV